MAGDALGFGVSFFILWTEEGFDEKEKWQKKGGRGTLAWASEDIVVSHCSFFYLELKRVESRRWPDRCRPVGSPSASASSSAGPCTHCPLPYQHQ